MIGDQVELWRKGAYGDEEMVWPAEGDYIGIVTKIGSPNSKMFEVTKVNHWTERKEFYNMYIDPTVYNRNGYVYSWKGATVEYYLDQVMDSEESLL